MSGTPTSPAVPTSPPRGMHFPGALLRGAAWSVVGMVAARMFFPGDAALISVVLIALGQAGYVQALLDRNRDEVYGGAMTPRRANLRMARELFGLFIGVFLAYCAAVSLLSLAKVGAVYGDFLGEFRGTRLRDVDFGTFGVLMQRNAVVLFASFLLSTLYQHGGILLVLAWNAARWGVVLGFLTRTEAAHGGVEAALTVAIVLPHLIFEALSYVLAAMSGAFLGRGLLRHRIGSPIFDRVGLAVLGVLFVSGMALVVASFFESRLNGLLGGG